MTSDFRIVHLTQARFKEAVDLVMRAELDSREEVEHHLQELDAHFTALKNDKIIGVIGWYQDNVNYATEAMGDKFPGVEAFWVGFFAVDKNHQGKRVGKSLIEKLEKEVIGKGADKLWVSSVPQTWKYYERLGFKSFMKGTISGNIKHFMVKEL